MAFNFQAFINYILIYAWISIQFYHNYKLTLLWINSKIFSLLKNLNFYQFLNFKAKIILINLTLTYLIIYHQIK